MREAIQPQERLFWEGQSDETWFELPRLLYDTELVYTTLGPFKLDLAGTVFEMHPGSLALIPPKTLHESWVEPGFKTFRHCVHFTWWPNAKARELPLQCSPHEKYQDRLLQPIPSELRNILPCVFSAKETEPLREQLELLFAKLRVRDAQSSLYLWPILMGLFGEMSRSREPESQLQGGRAGRAVLELKNFIETEYKRETGYTDFVRVTGYTEGYLCTSFRKLTGVSPTQYLNQVRVRQAQRLFTDTKLSIKEVALQCGVPDANYFARLFRQKTGMTPSAWQENVQRM